MNQLEEIKKGVEACRTYNFGMRYANKLAHEDADKLIAALEAVEDVLKKLDTIQEEDNVSRNACAGAIANVIRDVIAEEVE